MPLLTTNTKLQKSLDLGYRTFGIHLAPEKLSGFNVCKNSSAGCRAACLNTAGMGAYSSVQLARINKTKYFFTNKDMFMEQLIKEIGSAIKNTVKKGLIPCFRLNLTSDLPWHKIKHNGKTVMDIFDDVRFYDYTPDFDRMVEFLDKKLPKNYHLTFSRKEDNDLKCQAILGSKGNVAIVFNGEQPKKFNGKRTVDGDLHDLRFLDPKGCIVGLKGKRHAKIDKTGFALTV